MALEKVNIKDTQYSIHQAFPSYGIDEIGNPHYLGEDYLNPELISIDKALSKDGKVCYSYVVKHFDEEEDFIFWIDVTQAEDEFIASCLIEIDDNKKPTGVTHKNGDEWDNCFENLEWEYMPQDLL